MDLASRIEHTNLKPEADAAAIQRLCEEAKAHQFAAVCVNGRFVEQAARALGDSEVGVCATVSFPLGAGKSMVKAIEATSACKDGADEIDFVAHLPALLEADLTAAKADFLEVVKAARAVRASTVVKVIIESALLTAEVSDAAAERRIATACQAAQESGCDYVKTSSSFHPAGGASVEAVALMRRHAGPLKVKAAGGVRDRAAATALVEAGADRIGCSAGVSIVEAAA
jgi:deoxyribose-phosphate aldolase